MDEKFFLPLFTVEKVASLRDRIAERQKEEDIRYERTETFCLVKGPASRTEPTPQSAGPDPLYS